MEVLFTLGPDEFAKFHLMVMQGEARSQRYLAKAPRAGLSRAQDHRARRYTSPRNLWYKSPRLLLPRRAGEDEAC